jgi:hypothetical protein
MDRCVIRAPLSGDFQYDQDNDGIALDEYDNIYVIFVNNSNYYRWRIVLWICDPDINHWQRRVLSVSPAVFDLKLLCVRKDMLYAICHDRFVTTCSMISICQKTGRVTTLKRIKKTSFLTYPPWEIWNEEELRFFEFKNRRLIGYRALDLRSDDFSSSSSWTRKDLSSANVFINSEFDKICVCKDYVYVLGDDKISKYEARKGICECVFPNRYENYFFCTMNDRLCYLYDRALMVYSEQEEEPRRVEYSFDVQKIVGSRDKLYVLKFHHEGMWMRMFLALGFLSFKVSLLEDIAVRCIAAHLNTKAPYKELKDRIGQLALRFKSKFAFCDD